MLFRSYQNWAGITPTGLVDERTWNSIYDSFVTANYSLSRDTVRAQSLGENAVPVLAAAAPVQPPDRWADTPRLGQYQGSPLKPGQADGGANGRRGVSV